VKAISVRKAVERSGRGLRRREGIVPKRRTARKVTAAGALVEGCGCSEDLYTAEVLIEPVGEPQALPTPISAVPVVTPFTLGAVTT
jgi:hypothetical protein